jgi:hypothetical protein
MQTKQAALLIDLSELVLKPRHFCPQLLDVSLFPSRLSQFPAAFQNLHRKFYALVRVRHGNIPSGFFYRTLEP